MDQLSEAESKILKAQIKRREKYRKEFFKLRTDPHKNSMEPGCVFDPALQRWLSMKACQYEYFYANPKTIMSGTTLVVLPMFIFGYFVYQQRSKFERDCRCGNIRPRDRMFKLH